MLGVEEEEKGWVVREALKQSKGREHRPLAGQHQSSSLWRPMTTEQSRGMDVAAPQFEKDEWMVLAFLALT